MLHFLIFFITLDTRSLKLFPFGSLPIISNYDVIPYKVLQKGLVLVELILLLKNLAMDVKSIWPLHSDVFTSVLQSPRSTQKALHANMTGISYPWQTCRCVDWSLTELFLSPCHSSAGNFCYIFILFFCLAVILLVTTGADSPLSMLPIYRELIAAGLRIWVYPLYIFYSSSYVFEVYHSFWI